MSAFEWIWQKLVVGTVYAVWRDGLRDTADKPGQFLIITILCRAFITIETLAEGAFIFLMLSIVAAAILVAVPLRWCFLEIRDTWFPKRVI